MQPETILRVIEYALLEGADPAGELQEYFLGHNDRLALTECQRYVDCYMAAIREREAAQKEETA